MSISIDESGVTFGPFAQTDVFEFDKKFDDGADITNYLDLSKAKRIKQEHKRVNVDFPVWMIDSLDKEATRLGVTRQSVIKVWLGERLQQQKV